MDHQMLDETTHTITVADAAPNSNIKVACGYVLQERLGAGSFATVYKGIRLAEYQQAINDGSKTKSIPPSSIAAIKAISRSSKKLTKKVLENLDLEIAILRTYRHPNIVCLHEVQKTDRHFYLVLEYCGGGDLQRLIRTRQKGRLSERLCRRLVRDLAAGLGFLWGKEIVHRDIKPQNLLLTGPLPAEELVENPPREDAKRALQNMTGERFQLKIADFGFARHLSREQDKIDLAETMCGSPLYMAPEILEYQPYDAKADLWSVGAVLFEMVAGKTPFHGENHIDLMKNIKKKAVRLPANVRISKEFVQLLKLLLNRKPQDRAGFEAFFAASEAFVALGCNGTPTVVPSLDALKIDNTASTDESTTPSHPLSSGQQIIDRDVCTQMNLCAISENEGGSESFHQGGTGSLATVATLGTVNRQQLQQQQQQQQSRQPSGTNYVVTPPLNPIMSTQPPPILGLHKGINQQGNTTRQSVFTPLQGSPNLSPYTPSKLAGPPQFSLSQAYKDIPQSLPSPRPRPTQDRHVFSATVQQQQQMQHQQQRSINSAQQVSQNNVVANRSPRTSSHDSQSSDDFVLVEYNSGSRGRGSGYNSPSSSRPGSGYNSPSTSGIHHSPSISPHSSVTGRVTILDARNNIGICGTSPGTGRDLFGKMMRGSPGASSLTPTATGSVGSGRFGVSPRSALKTGGCLAHIDVLVHMLAAAEDICRRAIQVAHLGDLRAFSAGELMLKHKEESQLSSMSTETPSTPMEGVDCVTQAESRRLSANRAVIEEEEGEELPFAMTTSSGGSSERMPSSSSENNNLPNIVKSSNEKPREEVTVLMILTHSREAIRCYCKALDMIRVTIRASRKVMKEIEDIPPPQVGNPSTDSQNPYNPIKKRCADSLQWSSAMFTAVLERADVANEEVSKLEKANSIEEEGDISSICLEELIYNHSLKCGHEGAKKQMDGDYEAARECFKSAGLLAETLLMNSTVAEDDKVLLDGYVNSFADQILFLDELRRVELRKSRRQSSDML